jgi:hypothetical protein
VVGEFELYMVASDMFDDSCSLDPPNEGPLGEEGDGCCSFLSISLYKLPLDTLNGHYLRKSRQYPAAVRLTRTTAAKFTS